MMKDAARVEAKRVVVAEERGWRCGGMSFISLLKRIVDGGGGKVELLLDRYGVFGGLLRMHGRGRGCAEVHLVEGTSRRRYLRALFL
jgi:hypothetical protein